MVNFPLFTGTSLLAFLCPLTSLKIERITRKPYCSVTVDGMTISADCSFLYFAVSLMLMLEATKPSATEEHQKIL